MDNKQPNKCACVIGLLCGNGITKFSFIEGIKQAKKVQKDWGIDLPDDYQVLDYLERFSYCPRCGSRIDWEEITNELSKE